MRILRLPKTLRWIAACAFLLMLTIVAYRVVIFFLFKDLFVNGTPSVTAAFLLGLAFDARIMAIVTVLAFALSFWPGIHYFKTKTGKNVAICLFAVALFVIHIFYMADIAHLRCFGERLNGAIISDLAKNTNRGNYFIKKMEWFILLASSIVLVLVFILVTSKTHKLIAKARSTSNSSVRIFWNSFLFVFLVILIYGGFRTRPLSIDSVSKNYNKQALQFAITPFDSFFGSLPKKH